MICSLDIKKTFTYGLWQVQKRLHLRYYVQATTLAEDIAIICKNGIESVALTLPSEEAVGSAEYNAMLKVAIHEVKDRKKLAKRIIKAIQPQLEVAVRAEADLLQKSPDKMVADLELVLEGCIDISPEALLGPTRHGIVDPSIAVQSIEGADTAADDNIDVNQQISVEAQAANNVALTQANEVDMLDEDAPGEIDDGDAFASIPRAEDETPGTSADSSTKPTMQVTAAQSSDTPPGANDYPTGPAHHLPQPPTPPVSNPSAGSIISQDLASTSAIPGEPASGSFLTGGGKPWYLNKYDSLSRTFEEPQWAAPEVARGMSEELSEIDDDEMRDLEEGMDAEMGDGAKDTIVAEGKKVGKAPKKPKAKKRWRGYR